ncbi:MAG: DUF2505 domain-containing protein [Propionicimonas sp.]|jgi:uncharacterized protein YndB with AHSA1/START domain
MEISATHQYPQPPAATFAMLTDPAFLEAVCVATDPLDYSVYVEGLRTGARRTMKNHTSIERFTGPTITVTDEVAWAEADGDIRTGLTVVAVEGMPVTLRGTVTLAPAGEGASLTYAGDLTVAIPLLGPALERQAAPLLLEALSRQAEVAQTWPQDSSAG